MHLVFFGSSPFSVPVMNRILNTEHRILAVVTTPDAPAGRHLKLTPNPVKLLAQKNDIPVYDHIIPLPPLKLRGGIKEGDITQAVGLVAAYGKIIPQEVLNTFGNRIYNIHPSLLPKYRGPSPLQQQILDGITETGVTIIQLDAKMDHGPIVLQSPATILPNDTWLTLGERLFSIGADLFIENYLLAKRDRQIEIVNCELKIQNDSLATYTPKLTRQSGFVEFEKLKNYLKIGNWKLEIERMHRAFAVWPGVWTIDPSGRRLKLISLNPIMVQYEGQKPSPYVFPS